APRRPSLQLISNAKRIGIQIFRNTVLHADNMSLHMVMAFGFAWWALQQISIFSSYRLCCLIRKLDFFVSTTPR
ncbi:unnamed protein product, partial [Amoebophrya sp. A120]